MASSSQWGSMSFAPLEYGESFMDDPSPMFFGQQPAARLAPQPRLMSQKELMKDNEAKAAEIFQLQTKVHTLENMLRKDASSDLRKEKAELEREKERLEGIVKSQNEAMETLRRSAKFSQDLSHTKCEHHEIIQDSQRQLQERDLQIIYLQEELEVMRRENEQLRDQLQSVTAASEQAAAAQFKPITPSEPADPEPSASSSFLLNLPIRDIAEMVRAAESEKRAALEREQKALEDKESIEKLLIAQEIANQQKQRDLFLLEGKLKEADQILESVQREHQAQLESQRAAIYREIEGQRAKSDEEAQIAARRRYEESYGQAVVGRMRRQSALLVATLEHIHAVMSPYTVVTAVKRTDHVEGLTDEQDFVKLESNLLKSLKDLTNFHRQFELRCQAMETNFREYIAPLAEQIEAKQNRIEKLEKRLEKFDPEETEASLLLSKHQAAELVKEVARLKEELRHRDREFGRDHGTSKLLELEHRELQTKLGHVSRNCTRLIQALSSGDQREVKRSVENLYPLVGNDSEKLPMSLPFEAMSSIRLGDDKENRLQTEFAKLHHQNQRLKKKVEKRDELIRKALARLGELQSEKGSNQGSSEFEAFIMAAGGFD